MAGNRHQFILGLVIKKMREEGICVSCVDGPYPGLLGESVPLPPTILRHRPDAVGIRDNGQICVGEAKTENDISNNRTYAQLQDFTSIELNGSKCEVYVGIPQSGKDVFIRSLKRTGLADQNNLHVLYVPDEIIND